MDPDACLERVRELVSLVSASDEDALDYAQDLADAIRDLDEWLTKGGYRPSAWVRLWSV